MNLKYPKVIYPILFCKYIFTASRKGGQICTQMMKVVLFLKVVQLYGKFVTTQRHGNSCWTVGILRQKRLIYASASTKKGNIYNCLEKMVTNVVP